MHSTDPDSTMEDAHAQGSGGDSHPPPDDNNGNGADRPTVDLVLRLGVSLESKLAEGLKNVHAVLETELGKLRSSVLNPAQRRQHTDATTEDVDADTEDLPARTNRSPRRTRGKRTKAANGLNVRHHSMT